MRKFEDLKIAVAGTGYVGMSMATLLAQHHEVMAVDVIPEKVERSIIASHPYRTIILKNSLRRKN